MNTEEKQLLLKDLCARVPYGVMCDRLGHPLKLVGVHPNKEFALEFDRGEYMPTEYTVEDVKPYLRPMSSMTEEEFGNLKVYSELEYDQLEMPEWDNGYKTLEFWLEEVPSYVVILVFDWFNKNHFDYRGLIERGLALEAPKGIYKEK